jgi:hypothetical protein
MLRFMLDEQTVANSHSLTFPPPPPLIVRGQHLSFTLLQKFLSDHTMGGEAAGPLLPEAQGTVDRKGKLLVSGATVKVTGLKGAPQHNGGSRSCLCALIECSSARQVRSNPDAQYSRTSHARSSPMPCLSAARASLCRPESVCKSRPNLKS